MILRIIDKDTQLFKRDDFVYDEETELAVNNIHNHLKWSESKVNKNITKASKLNYIIEKDNLIKLTNQGVIYHNHMIEKLSD